MSRARGGSRHRPCRKPRRDASRKFHRAASRSGAHVPCRARRLGAPWRFRVLLRESGDGRDQSARLGRV